MTMAVFSATVATHVGICESLAIVDYYAELPYPYDWSVSKTFFMQNY